MAGSTAMIDAPMMAVMLMVWLLIAGILVLGIVAFAKWLLRRNRP